jgi:hypothetical protein
VAGTKDRLSADAINYFCSSGESESLKPNNFNTKLVLSPKMALPRDTMDGDVRYRITAGHRQPSCDAGEHRSDHDVNMNCETGDSDF